MRRLTSVKTKQTKGGSFLVVVEGIYVVSHVVSNAVVIIESGGSSSGCPWILWRMYQLGKLGQGKGSNTWYLVVPFHLDRVLSKKLCRQVIITGLVTSYCYHWDHFGKNYFPWFDSIYHQGSTKSADCAGVLKRHTLSAPIGIHLQCLVIDTWNQPTLGNLCLTITY